MAKEKFIRGKRDDAAHDGRYSNVKREQQVAEEERYGREWLAERKQEQIIFQRKKGGGQN